jgi:hypothetical protein
VIVCAHCESVLGEFPIPVASEASLEVELVCSSTCGEQLIKLRSQQFFVEHQQWPHATRQMVYVASNTLPSWQGI